MLKITLEYGKRYWIDYEYRDIGYGAERDSDDFVYRGREEPWPGKLIFEPYDDDGPLVYLFEDEVIGIEPL